MIGCLIAGGLAALAVSRIAHHRRWCHGGGWRRHHGWHGGGWGCGRGGYGRYGRGWGSMDIDDGPENDVWLQDDPWGGGPGAWRKRFFVRRLVDHVRATPEQERRIVDAVRDFRDEVKRAGSGEGRRSRHELADALRGQTFDGVSMGEQFARHDTLIEGLRKAYVGLIARVHDTLEPEQRGRLADLVDRGPRMGFWARGM